MQFCILFFYLYNMENEKIGLGDLVEKTIKVVTLNKIKACGGCQRRKKILNGIKLPFSNYKPPKK